MWYWLLYLQAIVFPGWIKTGEYEKDEAIRSDTGAKGID